jgi:hypothetical protein
LSPDVSGPPNVESSFCLPPHPVAINRSANNAIRDTDNRRLVDFKFMSSLSNYIHSYHIICADRNPLSSGGDKG